MKYELSICAICKDETDYLEEWINFNRCIGVEHFYIYDNDSAVPVKITLDKYIDAGYVTVFDFPGSRKQIPAYHDFINNHKNDSKWVAFLDCDEFLIPKQVDTIQEILKDYENYGGLCVNWVMFGSNGFLTKPLGLITESYTLSKVDQHIKTIVQSEFVSRSAGPSHCFRYEKGYYAVSEDFKKVDYAYSVPSINKIQLNHYFTKSFEEWEKKVQRGTADGFPKRLINNIYAHDKWCNDIDISAFRFIEKTKKLYL
jgi:hypothetical protein